MARRKKNPVHTPAQIRAIREKLGLTPREAGERVGVSGRTWYHWEAGERTPSKSCAILIQLLKDGEI